MDKPINVHDAKTNFSRLLDRAAAGEEIVIAKAGKPVARLTALPAGSSRKPGLAKAGGRFDDSRFDEPLSKQELARWTGEA